MNLFVIAVVAVLVVSVGLSLLAGVAAAPAALLALGLVAAAYFFTHTRVRR